MFKVEVKLSALRAKCKSRGRLAGGAINNLQECVDSIWICWLQESLIHSHQPWRKGLALATGIFPSECLFYGLEVTLPAA